MNLTLFSISGAILGLTCLIHIIIILIYGKTKLHRLWALFNVAVAFWGFSSFWIGMTSTEKAGLISWRVAHIGVIFIAVFFFHVICAFCEISRPKIIIFAYVQGIFFSLVNTIICRVKYVFNSFYYDQSTGPFYLTFFWIWVSLVIWGHFELYKFYKKAQGIKRNQSLYFFVGMLIGFIGGITNFFPVFGINLYPWGNFTIPIYCILVTYAILRHQLMDIRIAIRKTLVYSVLISLITAIYFIIIYVLERTFSVIAGYKSIPLAVAIVALFSIIFTPLKNKIQYAVDKYFFKGTIDQIEKEKELLETELQRSERLKTVSTLAAGMAHEIKNPLTSIKAFVEYMDREDQDPEFKAKLKSIVPQEIDKISNIINQLLSYSRPERIHFKTCDIHQILDYVLDLYHSQLLEKHIKLQKSYNTQFPNIRCDENQLKQVFINIVLNSIEAMPNGGELTVETRDMGDTIEIIVRDTGIGIPKDKIKNLFDPFYTTKEKGTGLGLFVAYQILQKNQGKIFIESEINKGTLVNIRFSKNTP